MDDRKGSKFSPGDVVRLVSTNSYAVGPEMVVAEVMSPNTTDTDSQLGYELRWWDANRNQFAKAMLPGCVLRLVQAHEPDLDGAASLPSELNLAEAARLLRLLRGLCSNAHDKVVSELRTQGTIERVETSRAMIALGIAEAVCVGLLAEASL